MDESELQYGELCYEDRLVAFFDTLGWREQIRDAGDDPRHIARLASLPKLFSKFVTDIAPHDPGAQITSFSDNVIVSVPYNLNSLNRFLSGIATVQLGLALSGFWIRGALTIGKIRHDEHLVFGPALNRAYELETKHAIYPRVLVDPENQDFIAAQAGFIESEEGYTFVDPFSMEFIDQTYSIPINAAMVARFNALAGAAVTAELPGISSIFLLGMLLRRAIAELKAADLLKVWIKYAWLIDRIAPRIGDPVRSSDFDRPTK